jgi:hypothetical protein
MAVAMLMELPGVTQEQYDKVMEELQLETMPPGGIFHMAAPMEGGWRVLDVWETREEFERFAQDRLAAAMQKVGVPQSGEPKFQELHNILMAKQTAAA